MELNEWTYRSRCACFISTNIEIVLCRHLSRALMASRACDRTRSSHAQAELKVLEALEVLEVLGLGQVGAKLEVLEVLEVPLEVPEEFLLGP